MIYREKILESIVNNFFDTGIIKDRDVLLVALSGGMDSMCLMDAFYKLQSEVNYKLMAIHVHHGIRGKEADRDLEFVKEYCNSMDIKLIEEKVDAVKYAKKNNLTIEEAARILRYDAFEKNWKKLSSKNSRGNVYILVAHHEKDQAETVIHNMLRGTGIKGLVGMKMQNGNILRPLLNIKKSEIEKYVDTYDVPYVNDSTNDDTKYTRNFIRKEILDKFDEINSAAITHIAELSKQAKEINDFIELESKKAYKKVFIKEDDNSIVLSLSKFRLKDRIIKVGIIREVFDSLVSTLKDITKINIDDIIELSDKDKGGHLDLPYNLTVDKKQNALTFTKHKKNVSMSRRKKK
jgi:tRNA(Ile)-lysidine synthase